MKKYILYALFIALIVSAVLMCSCLFRERGKVSHTQPTTVSVQKSECTHDLNQLLTNINSFRSESDLKSLSLNNTLSNFAQERATALGGTVDNHIGFKALVSSQKYHGFSYFGENLQGDKKSWCKSFLFSDAKDTFDMWKSSQNHRENMLVTRWDSIVLAFKDGVFVAIFGQTAPSTKPATNTYTPTYRPVTQPVIQNIYCTSYTDSIGITQTTCH